MPARNALLRLRSVDKDRALVAAIGAAGLVRAGGGGRPLGGGRPGAVPGRGLARVGVAAGALEVVVLHVAGARARVGAAGAGLTISRGGALVLVRPLSIAAFGEPLTRGVARGQRVVLLGLALSSVGLLARAARAGRGGALVWAGVCAAAIASHHLA